MQRHHWNFSLLIVLVLVAGASAGVVASVLLDQSLEEYAAGLFAGRQPAVPRSGVPRSTPNSYSEAVERVKTVAQPSMAMLLAPSLDSRLAGSWVSAEEATGYGVVVSTDGWILVHRDAVVTTNVLRGLEVWIDGERYAPTQYVQDTLTDFALIKVAVSNLTPAAFGTSENVTSGEEVFVLAGDTLTSTMVTDAMAMVSMVGAAEEFHDRWTLVDGVSAGAGIFSRSGDLLALAGEDEVLPMHYGAAFVREVMRDGATAHAGFGAAIVDVRDPLNIDSTMRQGREDGALVVSVVASGAAAAAGVQVGDVIVALDDVRVNSVTTLPELLALYDPGQTAQCTVVRNGAETSFTVTFGTYDDLLY